MPWQGVNTNAIDIKTQKGVPFEGKFTGSKHISTQYGDQVIWQFEGKDGLGIGVYGFTNLNRAMETLSPGTLVKATYTGKEMCDTKTGRKEVHQVDVQAYVPEGEDDKLPF